MTATPDQIEARIAALLALVPMPVITTAAQLAGATLPVAEIERPRRVTQSKRADEVIVTAEWVVWHYLDEVKNPENDDVISDIFSDASDHLRTLANYFARHPRLDLGDSGIVWGTGDPTAESGLKERGRKTYAAIRLTLPIITKERVR